MSDKKQQVIDLHNEQRQTVAHRRLELLKALDDLKEFGGVDQYETSVPIIVKGYGAEGVILSRIRDLFPAATEFNKVVKGLKDNGDIEEVGKGRSVRLKALKLLAAPSLEATASTERPETQHDNPATPVSENPTQNPVKSTKDDSHK